MFESLAVVKDEKVVLGRDYLRVNIRYACFAMCHGRVLGVESNIDQG